MAKQEVQVVITGNAAGLFQTLKDASRATQGMATEMSAALGGVKTMLLGFASIFGGLEFLKGTVEETKTWTVEAQKLARVLGITTEAASVLNLAIGDIYGTQEEYLGAVAKLTKTLNTSEESFTKLGVATRDQNGRLRDTPSIMTDVNQALLGMKQGTDRNIASAQIYGKSWLDVQRYLKLTPEVMAEAEEKAKRLNLIVGTDMVDATDAYRASMNELEDTLKALKIRIGMEVMPALTDFNNAVSEDGPEALSVLGIAVNGVVTAFKVVGFVIQTLAVTISSIVMGVWEMMAGVTEGLVLFIQGEYKQAWGAVKKGYQGMTTEIDAGNEEIQARWEKMGLSLNYLWDPALRPKAKAKVAPGGDNAATPKGKEEPDKEFERLKAQLAAEKDVYEQRQSAEGTFHLYTKEMEDTFWKKALATQHLEGNSLSKVQQAQFAAAHEARKKKHADDLALDDTYRERYIAEQRAFLDEEEKSIERALVQGKISETQALEWKRVIERDKFDLELAGLNDRLAVKGIEPVELAKIHGQIEALEAQHAAKVAEFTNQQTLLDRQKDGWAGWTEGIRSSLAQAQNHFETFKQAAISVMQGIENAFAKGIEGILSGQMSLSQGIKAIWQGIVQTIIGAIAKLIAQYIVLQIAEAVLTKASVAGSGVKTAAYLTEGAAGAWAAYGWIPYAGPIMAMAQIALMNASVAAAGIMGGASKAFAGGSLAEGGEVTEAASGGWFDRPTLTMIGEGQRPELVVPDTSFKDFAANLSANILAQERQTAGYGRQASGYARAQQSASGGATAGSPLQLTVHMGGTILDSSQRGMRELGGLIIDGARAAARERGVVLVPGQVFGGL